MLTIYVKSFLPFTDDKDRVKLLARPKFRQIKAGVRWLLEESDEHKFCFE